ncbi:PmoA family protein [Parabacteroides hominis]|uniref:PmoA family protein n=1 Tax=Parabacteroides hominis TaxID=2763057 RepID=A0ABR7DJL2_9BACT|nr:PmoA family protein [Parabacteroides hominis]MBC5631614.1 PmoA family protein [Parabacteroides hominis]MBD9166750.1 hypothetical protein [Parabacteroides johnsonii]
MRQLISIILCSLLSVSMWAAGTVRIVVEAGRFDRQDCIVSTEISKLKIKKDTRIALFEQIGKEQKPVKCQLIQEKGGIPVLYWVLDGVTSAGTTREFVARLVRTDAGEETMRVEDTGKGLILKQNGRNVLQYNYAFVSPPAGIDPAYGRSGFIHPAYSPSGNVLTTIQPKDHYHHYGIWNPWTRIEYDGKMYDLWNLGDKQGTVRARKIDQVFQGSICAGYTARLDHCIFGAQGEKVIMDESWDVKAWNIPGGFLWDFESGLHPSTDLPVLIKAYRYAGFGWRATEEWTKENCEMFTSEGKTRQQIDGTTARWIYVTGQCGSQGRSGMLFLGHPENYNAPEPLRIWDEKANGGRGDAFVNFAPTKNKDWELMPGKLYKQRYRIFSYDGEMDREKADRLWNDFAYPPKVTVQ